MTCRLSFLLSLVVSLSALFVIVSAAPVLSQADAAKAQQTPGINYRERPKLTFNAQRLKRKPVIDGVIGENEWDALYTIADGPVTGTVYLNWDDDFLYVAAKTNQPAWTVIDIDSNGDGWLRGTDNIELAAAPLTEGVAPALIARVLDAASNKDTPVWGDKVVDTKAIQIAAKVNGGVHTVELAIPRGLSGLTPKPNGVIGFRADFLPSAATPSPTPPYEPHLLLELKLVEEQVVPAQGVLPKLVLDDIKLVPGQNLRAELHITSTDDQVQLRAITWKGEGAAADVLRLLRDPNTGQLSPRKPLRVKYSSLIPANALPGFYQISAIIELEGGKSATATTGFQIVEPFALQLSSQPDPFAPTLSNKLRITLDITNAVNAYVRGDAELEVPAGWVVEGRKKKVFDAPHEDETVKTQFFVDVPTTTTPGEYTVHATVSWKGKSAQAHRIVHIGKMAVSDTSKPKAGGK